MKRSFHTTVFMTRKQEDRVAQERDTSDRLLDATEVLFAAGGSEGISVRAVTTEAEANIAAVGYHFGSKDELIQAAITRRFEWLRRKRMKRLDELEAEAAPALPSLESVVDVFILPVLNAFPDQPERSAHLRAFFSRVFSESPEFQKSIRVTGLQQTADRFSSLMSAILPELPMDEIYWRIHFSAGPMLSTLLHGHRLKMLSHGQCDPDNVEDAVIRLRSFICAGLRAPARQSEPVSPPTI
jgi:AcrR family transcriptional regulator